MTSTDEIARLAQADPVPAGSLDPVPPPPAPERAPRRSRRVIGAVAAGAGVLALGGLVAALIISAPSDEAEAPATPPFDGTLRVSLLDRPQTEADRVDLGSQPIDPATTRLAVARDAGGSWFAGRLAGQPDSVCLARPVPTEVLCSGYNPATRSGLFAERWLPNGPGGDPAALVSELVGIVPDGIDQVAVGDVTAPVNDNVFALRITGPPPDHAVLVGPAAAVIPPIGDVAVATPTGSPPAVAVRLVRGGAAPEQEPSRDPGVPVAPSVAGVPGTLAEAAAAVPFTVLVPAKPPLPVEPDVIHTPPDPALIPQVTLIYAPRTAGPGVSVIEAAEGSTPVGTVLERPVRRDGRTYFVASEGQVRVRVVIDGTDVRISGPGRSTDGLIAVAASLRPAGEEAKG